MITERQYQSSAATLQVSIAAIKAVAQVESRGNGFLQTGEPVILFEPHIFWKELRKRGIDPLLHIKGAEDILYPVWGSKPYGRSSQQHARLARACAIHREAALYSASWGKFQIMGFNWKACGAKSLQDFINAMYESEDRHLELFTHYINTVMLDDELRNRDWKGFARGYNGALYYINRYDTKLKQAYEQFSK